MAVNTANEYCYELLIANLKGLVIAEVEEASFIPSSGSRRDMFLLLV